MPDGLAVDEAGGVWVAVYGAGEIRRIVDGRTRSVIDVPMPQTTSVALGGPDGLDVLVTTAQEGMDERARREDRFAGRLFHARAGVPAAAVRPVRPQRPTRSG